LFNNKFVYIAAERILHNVVGVMKNAEVMVFLTLIMFAGTFWGFIEAFLFWYFSHSFAFKENVKKLDRFSKRSSFFGTVEIKRRVNFE